MPLQCARKVVTSQGKQDAFKSLRPLVPQLRKALGTKVTDEALLTYLAKAEGNIEDAIRASLMEMLGTIQT